MLVHGALNFDSEGADFVGQILVNGGGGIEVLQNLAFDVDASLVRETHPEVSIVGNILNVTGVNGGGRNIAAENDCGKGLLILRDINLILGCVQYVDHVRGVFISVCAL